MSLSTLQQYYLYYLSTIKILFFTFQNNTIYLLIYTYIHIYTNKTQTSSPWPDGRHGEWYHRVWQRAPSWVCSIKPHLWVRFQINQTPLMSLFNLLLRFLDPSPADPTPRSRTKPRSLIPAKPRPPFLIPAKPRPPSLIPFANRFWQNPDLHLRSVAAWRERAWGKNY